MTPYDVIVLGLGGVGAAASYHAARRGRRVLALERFGVAHDRGSSHGETRIIRHAYAHAGYLPLLDRSVASWEELERRAARPLVRRTGLVFVADAKSRGDMDRARAAASRHGVVMEALDAQELAARFPRFRIPSGGAGLYEPNAGYVLVEESIRAHCALAREAGAELRFEEPVSSWRGEGKGVVVDTGKGRYYGGALVIAGGAWSAEVLADLGLPLVVERIPQAWYAAGADWSAEAGAPCFIFDLESGYFFGVPATAAGRLKVAGRNKRVVVPDPSQLTRGLMAGERAAIGNFIETHLPGVSSTPLAESVCMCTMTPNEHFIVDAHPACPQVVFAAGLSGHGYKFAPVLGEALAEMAIDGATRLPIDFLRRPSQSEILLQ